MSAFAKSVQGAVLAGRDGFDSAIGDSRPYGGAWEGEVFVLSVAWAERR